MKITIDVSDNTIMTAVEYLLNIEIYDFFDDRVLKMLPEKETIIERIMENRGFQASLSKHLERTATDAVSDAVYACGISDTIPAFTQLVDYCNTFADQLDEKDQKRQQEDHADNEQAIEYLARALNQLGYSITKIPK